MRLRLPRFRFSLLGLMAWVAYAALACAALRYSTEMWASSIFTLAMLSQMVAVLCVVLLRGQSRAAWIGFLVFGGGYLFLSSGPWPQADLITNRGLVWLSQKVQGDTPEQPVMDVVSGPLLSTYTSTAFTTSTALLWDARIGRSVVAPLQPPFLRIGHALLSPLLGLIGAIIASWMYSGGRKNAE